MVPMVVEVEGDVPKGLVFPGVRRLLAESGQPVVVVEEIMDQEVQNLSGG